MPSATPTSPDVDRLRLAYLNTRYPALSHTFIQREIEALRAAGAEVTPFSVRQPAVAELGEGADTAEISRTVYLIGDARRVASALLASLLCHPIRSLRTFAAAQRLSPGGLRARFKHLAYASEGMILARELRRRGLEFIHVHMANNGAMVALLACVFDRHLSYSMTIHGSAEFFNMEGLRVRQKVERASFVRLVSDSGRAQVMAFTDPSAWDRLHVIHCGIDPDTNIAGPAHLRRPTKLLAIGRLTAIKGYRVLLEALRLLSDRDLSWTLDLAGDGPDRASLEALATRLGIRDRVRFLGPIPPQRVRAELREAGALVVSSFMEGIPVVLMEAMAAGVPVVSTRVGGVPELVEDGVTGRLVSPGSPHALAKAIEELLSDPQAAAQRAVAARARVETDFHVRGCAAQLLTLFERHARHAAKPL